MPLQKIRLLLSQSFAHYALIFRQERLYGLYAFFFFAVFFLSAYLSLGDVLAIDDHLFHIRFAESILARGPAAFTDFQSVYFSEIVAHREHLIYYNFLFYLVLLPFSLLSPAVLGIKLFGALAMALALTVVYLFLRAMYVRYAFLWTLFFLVILAESGILIRLFAARPFTLAPVFIIGMLYLIYRKKFWSVALVSLSYFYWHTATFFLPLLTAVAYFVFSRFQYPAMRTEWRIIVMPLIGTVAAVLSSYLIFPGALSYLRDITIPVLFDAALPGGAGVLEGVEVYGADFFFIFSSLAPLIGLFLIFGSAEPGRLLRLKKKSGDHSAVNTSLETLRMTLFVGSAVLLAASLFSLRFADYFVYFSILYVALAAQDFLAVVRVEDARLWHSLKIGVLAVLAIFIIHIGPKLYQDTRTFPSYLSAQGPTDWMKLNLAPGTLIFNSDWDAHPLLYYFVGDQFRFATGLEPRFLYDYDARLYWLWRHIGENGIYCEQPTCSDELARKAEMSRNPLAKERFLREEGGRIADVIRDDFTTDIVVTRTDRTELIRLMDSSKRFRREYSDPVHSIFVVYRVLGNEFSFSTSRETAGKH